jgi:hypothetical protein
MRIPPWLLLNLLLVLVAAAPASAAPGTSKPRVAILNTVDLPPNLADIRTKLADQLGVAVTQRGYELVAVPPSTCVERDCLKSLATSSGATDILIASGARNQMLGYRIDLRLWDAGSDREDRSSPECNACSASQMVDNVVRAAGPLLDRLPALHVAPPPSPAAVAPAPPLVTATAPPLPPSPKLSPARVGLGIGLAGAGAVAAGFGISFLAVNGDQTNCTNGLCSRTYHTSTSGALLTAAGGVALATGAVVLLFFRDESSTSVALGPGGISLAGTY